MKAFGKAPVLAAHLMMWLVTARQPIDANIVYPLSGFGSRSALRSARCPLLLCSFSLRRQLPTLRAARPLPSLASAAGPMHTSHVVRSSHRTPAGECDSSDSPTVGLSNEVVIGRRSHHTRCTTNLSM